MQNWNLTLPSPSSTVRSLLLCLAYVLLPSWKSLNYLWSWWLLSIPIDCKLSLVKGVLLWKSFPNNFQWLAISSLFKTDNKPIDYNVKLVLLLVFFLILSNIPMKQWQIPNRIYTYYALGKNNALSIFSYQLALEKQISFLLWSLVDQKRVRNLPRPEHMEKRR